jgi:hypothetical protein
MFSLQRIIRCSVYRSTANRAYIPGGENEGIPEHINGKAHLNELASNPLMLTIICFLYAQPKYLLPDNRVEFYRECSRALLEKWDVARQAVRSNHFESDHKMDILSRIAYAHISKGKITDEEISVVDARNITKRALQALSLQPGDDGRVLQEIAENSGLLIELPPDSYRYPHRTFLEFFAAVYLYEQESVNRMLELYAQDEPRWKPALLMYAGLCRNREVAAQLLDVLTKRFTRSVAEQSGPDITVFSALIETSFATPETAEKLLNLAREHLKVDAAFPALIDEIGYISANTKWTYATRAREILYDLLERQLPHPILQVSVLAAMRCREDAKLRTAIAQRLNELDLVAVFIQAGHQAAYFLHRLLEVGMPPERKQQLIEGLREGGHFGLLADIMVESSDQDLADRGGHALFTASGTPGFTEFLDSHDPKSFNSSLTDHVGRVLADWGWPLVNPRSETGRYLAIAIAYHSARAILAGGRNTLDAGVIDWLSYLTRLELADMAPGAVMAVPSESQLWQEDKNDVTPFAVLKRRWKLSGSRKNGWNSVVQYLSTSDSLVTAIILLSCLFLLVAVLELALDVAGGPASLGLPVWTRFLVRSDTEATVILPAMAVLLALWIAKVLHISKNYWVGAIAMAMLPAAFALLLLPLLVELIRRRSSLSAQRFDNLFSDFWEFAHTLRWRPVGLLTGCSVVAIVLGAVLCRSGLICTGGVLIINGMVVRLAVESQFLVSWPVAGGTLKTPLI